MTLPRAVFVRAMIRICTRCDGRGFLNGKRCGTCNGKGTRP